jgi:hypothetical protein
LLAPEDILGRYIVDPQDKELPMAERRFQEHHEALLCYQLDCDVLESPEKKAILYEIIEKMRNKLDSDMQHFQKVRNGETIIYNTCS